MRFKTQEELGKLIGKKVVATGCCGEGDGVEVVGILKQLRPYAVVTVPNPRKKELAGQPYMVTTQSIVEVEDGKNWIPPVCKK